ncbi:hypothetical protein KAR52_01630 [Candidatus Pacearchaeota archaeon]|nr:hypothetical protein [Candidatus Pacearchaeota archaeon]
MKLVNFLKKGKKTVVIGAGILAWTLLSVGAFKGIGTPFYRIKQQYAAVITEVDGEKKVEERVGIHSRLKSFNPFDWVFSTKDFSMRMEYISYPPQENNFQSNNVLEDTIQAADKITFPGSWVWTYRIQNLEKFGIEMGVDAKKMLEKELESVAKAVIQSRNIEDIVTQINEVNSLVYNCNDVNLIEKKYGVEIMSFKLTKARYPTEMNERTAKAKGMKIEAEAYRMASEDYAQGFRTRAEANEYTVERLIEGSGVSTERGREKALDTVALFRLYEMLKDRQGGTIVLHPYGTVPNMTLPAQPTQVEEQPKTNTSVDIVSQEKPITSGRQNSIPVNSSSK